MASEADEASDWYDKLTIEKALAGDEVAGRDALESCARGLELRNLSEALADYLSSRIYAFLAGEPIARALCIERLPGRPSEPFPPWKDQLIAFDVLLERRGSGPEKRCEVIDTAVRKIDRRSLQKLRKTYAPMRALDEATLLDIAGPALRQKLEAFKSHRASP